MHADAIIVNFPSNDAVENFSLAEQRNNFKRISDAAEKNNILIWMASPQPRNNLNAAQVSNQKKLFNWLQEYYKKKFIDFYTGLASAKDSILYEYSYGDGIHLNDAGHKILYHRVIHEYIPDSLCNVKNQFQFADIMPLH